MYPLLSKLVGNEDVNVYSPGSLSCNEAGLEVRMNSDSLKADIYASTFYSDFSHKLHYQPRLVIGAVPEERVDYLIRSGNISSRDWREDYAHAEFDGQIEIVNSWHWKTLAASMPIFPLTGMVVLSMLATSDFRKCNIFGFNFYSDLCDFEFLKKVDYGFSPAYPFFLMHDYLLAVGFLRRMLVLDRRFVWKGENTLDQIEKIIRRRLFIVGGLQKIKNLKKMRNVGGRFLMS